MSEKGSQPKPALRKGFVEKRAFAGQDLPVEPQPQDQPAQQGDSQGSIEEGFAPQKLPVAPSEPEPASDSAPDKE